MTDTMTKEQVATMLKEILDKARFPYVSRMGPPGASAAAGPPTVSTASIREIAAKYGIKL